MTYTLTAATIRPGDIVKWYDGISPTATVTRVTSDFRQRAVKVWSIHFDNGVVIEAGVDRKFERAAQD